MNSARTLATTAATLAGLLLATPAIAAKPRCTEGRFALPDALTLPGETESTRLLAAQADGTLTLLGTTCGEIATSVETAGKNTLFKATVTSCDTPDFSIKVKLAPGCTTATATVKQGKKQVAREVGAPSTCGDGVVDPGAGEICELLSSVFCSNTCDTVFDPRGNATQAPPATTPRIDVFAPRVAKPGDSIALFGEFLDRRADGQEGTPDYVIGFENTRGLLSFATFTVVSGAELAVVVPADAVSGGIVMGVFDGDPKGPTLVDATRDDITIVSPPQRPGSAAAASQREPQTRPSGPSGAGERDQTPQRPQGSTAPAAPGA